MILADLLFFENFIEAYDYDQSFEITVLKTSQSNLRSHT